MANRLWRIYPLFVFFTFFGYLIYPQNYSFFGALQALLPIAGLPGAAETDLTAVAWAIRVEFEFYLVFPFIQHFTRRFGLRYLFGVLALFVMLRFWAFEQTGRAQDLAYWTILGRMDQFVIGMLIAHAHQAFIARARLRQVLALPALGFLLAWMYWFNHSGGWPLNERHRVLWPLGDALAYGALIFTYLGFEELPRFRASLPVRWFAKLGEMSFSVYLMHYFVLKTLVHKAWVLHLVKDPDKNALLNTALVLLPVTVALSVLTFNLIERPFFQFRKSYEPQPSR
jgi:peptidoglycan/LPS O-acetylase OafA/YrhL